MLDLNGIWLGTYWQSKKPTRFELSLIQAGNSISGNILDDGKLGEATLSGEVISKTIAFTKCYILRPHYHINYTGTIADEGNYMSGSWVIGRDNGNWEARRSEDLLMLKSNKVEVSTLSRK